ncbi:unnamed protein product [Ilex paraguariensis]|uniref:RNase H type-1 domain-containing protein n=1 Tax=Ilex paraguariensis TaxID=185542 RepID=A0ABC8TXH6_9AQUA
MDGWLRPPNGLVKVNYGGAFDEKMKKSAIGVVFRDHTGAILDGFAMQSPFVSSLYSKALAMREAYLRLSVLQSFKAIVELESSLQNLNGLGLA